jgi:hypothetical protein
MVCLAAAGAVAGYTHYSQDAADQTPVFTVHVPQRPPEPSASPITTGSIQRELPVPEDRASLVRALQRELKRVGCYSGEISGVWTTSSRMAMKSFTDHVNASLPIDNPDQVLLSLVRGHAEKACAPQTAAVGRASSGGVPDIAPEPPAEKQNTGPSTVAPAIAAGAALAAAAAAPKGEPRTDAADARGRPVAAAPETGPGSERAERSRLNGPVPPERVNERRKRRHVDRSRPPRFVRDFLRSFGIR